MITAALLGAVLLGSALWVRGTFGEISIDQLMLHLPGVGGAGLTGAETGYVSSFVWQGIVLPCLLVSLGITIIVRIRRWLFVPVGRYATPRELSSKRSRMLSMVIVLAVFVAGAGTFAQTVGLPQYLRSQFSPFNMADYYVNPEVNEEIAAASMVAGPEKPKNLVLIFLESIEDVMGDETVFEEPMLEPLKEATAGWASIPNYQEFAGGGWTMAGLVGSSCGVPLRGAGIGEKDLNSNEIGASADRFMPGAVCLGDVLADAGYTNVFLGGADASFASKSRFLYSHGYDEVKDLSTWTEHGETELSDWGLSDGRLLAHAKEEVVRLHESGQPFNLTMLTLDSHEPAHVFDYCEPTSQEEFESIIRCSMEQVADFISFLGDQGYLDDTVVVVSGDHRKMLGEAFSALNELADIDNRPIFNRIWSPDGVPALRAGADQLSLYPTVLDLLDLGREDHRAGVGVSSFIWKEPGSVLDLDADEYGELVESRSQDLYARLWDSTAAETQGTV